MPRIVVDVMLKPEILDPQGRAVQGALSRLGLAGVSSVRQGKRFEIELEGDLDEQLQDKLEELAGSLLSNPVIEDWNLYAADEAGRPAEQAKSQEQSIEPDLTPAQEQGVPVDAVAPDAQLDIESVSDVASVADHVTVPDDVPTADAQPAPEVPFPETESESAPVSVAVSVPQVAPDASQEFASWDDTRLRAVGEGQ